MNINDLKLALLSMADCLSSYDNSEAGNVEASYVSYRTSTYLDVTFIIKAAGVGDNYPIQCQRVMEAMAQKTTMTNIDFIRMGHGAIAPSVRLVWQIGQMSGKGEWLNASHTDALEAKAAECNLRYGEGTHIVEHATG